jgi:putative SOS response-associated peptidase YedK
LINARSETVAEKSAFRSAFKSRRCLIPSDGFYEWKQVGNKKQPYHFHLANGQRLAFAGLWERRNDIDSCAILTTEANELSAQFHDRMPVILSPNDYEVWLDPNVTDPSKLLSPYPASEIEAVAVNPIVNNARKEVPECIEPFAAE